MPLLDVSGASLHYSTVGTGPLVLLIPGANGDAPIFGPLAKSLASNYTVATYDRRGFAHSPLTGVQDYSGTNRLATDADDAAALIKHLSSSGELAYVLGNSSGAIVALMLVKRHSDAVKKAIIHEPPLTDLLGPGGAHLQQFFGVIYQTYQDKGIEAAMRLFAESQAQGDEGELMKASLDFGINPSKRKDMTYWLEHELTKYTATPIAEFAVSEQQGKVVPAHGADSQQAGSPLCAAAGELGKLVGMESVQVPGGHIGFVLHPESFAEVLQRQFV